MNEEVLYLSDQGFQYIPEASVSGSVSGYVRLEVIKSYQPVDGEHAREFLFERWSWASSTSAAYFEPFREIPFGLATVSGA